ncbi:MAG: hypothetical protein RIS90_1415, partial [Pseudomonadota bacterium]
PAQPGAASCLVASQRVLAALPG